MRDKGGLQFSHAAHHANMGFFNPISTTWNIMWLEFSFEDSPFHINIKMWNISSNHREVTDAGSAQLGVLLGLLYIKLYIHFLVLALLGGFEGCEYDVMVYQTKCNGKT